MKRLIVVLTILLAGFTATAQPYNWGVGVRGGLVAGSFNARHYLSSSNAIDLGLNVGFGKTSSFGVSAAYEFTQPVIDNGFEFYYGLGASAGAFNGAVRNADGVVVETHANFSLGVFGVVGLEYAFPTVPLSLFMDYRPGIGLHLGHDSGFSTGFGNFGIGIRINF